MRQDLKSISSAGPLKGVWPLGLKSLEFFQKFRMVKYLVLRDGRPKISIQKIGD